MDIDGRGSVVHAVSYAPPAFRPLTKKRVLSNMRMAGATQHQVDVASKSMSGRIKQARPMTADGMVAAIGGKASCMELFNFGNEGWGMGSTFWTAAVFLTAKGRRALQADAIATLPLVSVDSAMLAARCARDGFGTPSTYASMFEDADVQRALNLFHAMLALVRNTARTGNQTCVWKDSTPATRELVAASPDVLCEPSYNGYSHTLTLREHRDTECELLNAVDATTRAVPDPPVTCMGHRLAHRLTSVDVPGGKLGISQWVAHACAEHACAVLWSDTDISDARTHAGAHIIIVPMVHQMPTEVLLRFLRVAVQRGVPVLLVGDSMGPLPSPAVGWGQPWLDMCRAAATGVVRGAADVHVPRIIKTHLAHTVYSALTLDNARCIVANAHALVSSASVLDYPDATSWDAKTDLVRSLSSRFAPGTCVVLASTAVARRLEDTRDTVGVGDAVNVAGRWPCSDVVQRIVKRRDNSAVHGRVPLRNEHVIVRARLYGDLDTSAIKCTSVVEPAQYTRTSVDHAIVLSCVHDDNALMRVLRTVERTIHCVGFSAAQIEGTVTTKHNANMFSHACMPLQVARTRHAHPDFVSTLHRPAQ